MIKRKQHGFTIVELLIVIVVIAILAAITIVAYNGVSQRATNASVVSTASNVHKLLLSYVSSTGSYPGNSGGCVVLTEGTNGCSTGVPNNNGWYGGVINNLATIGTVPKYVPSVSPNYNGVLYIYDASRTMQGQAAPVLLVYFLKGDAQDCGGIGNLADGTGTTLNKSTLPYTTYGSGATTCSVSIPGPSA